MSNNKRAQTNQIPRGSILDAFDIATTVGANGLRRFDRSATSTYRLISVVLFAIVLYTFWSSISGGPQLKDFQVVHQLVLISCASAFWTMSVRARELAKAMPEADRGCIRGIIIWGLICFISIRIIWDTTDPDGNYADVAIWAGLILMHVLPKAIYAVSRDMNGANLIAKYKAQAGEPVTEKEAEAAFIAFREKHVRPLACPSKIAYFAIPLALLTLLT